MTFTPQTSIYEKCHNTSFCSKCQNRFEYKSSSSWTSQCCTKAPGHVPRPHHLDQSLLSSVRTNRHHALIVQALTLTKVQTALLILPGLAWNSLPGLKGPESNVQPLSIPHSHSPPSFSQMLPGAGHGSLLFEEQIEAHHPFSVFSLLLSHLG